MSAPTTWTAWTPPYSSPPLPSPDFVSACAHACAPARAHIHVHDPTDVAAVEAETTP